MSETTTAPTLIPEPEMEDTHYGIAVSHIGDDGEGLIALGHHEPRRVLAAFNRHSRVFVGLAGIWDCAELGAVELLPLLSERWGFFRKPDPNNEWEDPDFTWVLEYCEPGAPNARAVTLLWDR